MIYTLQKWLAVLLVFVITICTSHNSMAFAADEEIYSNMNFQIYVNLNDEFEYTNEELFAGYMQQIMYPQLAISTYGSFGESQLNGNELEYYQSLKYQIEEVAQSGGSTKMSLKYNGEMTQESVQAELRSVGNVLSYLLNDCPYSLYWFDKTIGMSLSLNPFARIITFSMPVSADYAVENEAYQVDTEKIQRANAVPIAAKKIVDKYADKSDYEKLLGYKNEICSLVTYDNDAIADEETISYGDPWQIINVFDDDETTNVVCEGYSKAFQYLCDLSDFQNPNVSCYLVTGIMSDTQTENGGGHMWNLVTMENNQQYLVDITNCDTGTIGAPEKLFLTGTEGNVEDGYVFSDINILYMYDTDLISMYGNTLLTIASSNYITESNISTETIVTTTETSNTITSTDILTSITLPTTESKFETQTETETTISSKDFTTISITETTEKPSSTVTTSEKTKESSTTSTTTKTITTSTIEESASTSAGPTLPVTTDTTTKEIFATNTDPQTTATSAGPTLPVTTDTTTSTELSLSTSTQTTPASIKYTTSSTSKTTTESSTVKTVTSTTMPTKTTTTKISTTSTSNTTTATSAGPTLPVTTDTTTSTELSSSTSTQTTPASIEYTTSSTSKTTTESSTVKTVTSTTMPTKTTITKISTTSTSNTTTATSAGPTLPVTTETTVTKLSVSSTETTAVSTVLTISSTTSITNITLETSTTTKSTICTSKLTDAYTTQTTTETTSSITTESTTTTPTIDKTMLLGDVDQNKKVDSYDAYLILLYYANYMSGNTDYKFSDDPELEEQLLKQADVDENAEITTSDAYLILLYYSLQSAGEHITWNELK